MLVERKLNVKSLGEKCQALKDLESGLPNKEVAKTLNTKRCILLHWNNL